jgi:uncharacterized protein (TIGR03435 family)
MKSFLPLAILGLTLSAQDTEPSKKLEFEVASVKPCEPDNSSSTNTNNLSVRIHNATLKSLISFAYDIDIAMIFDGPPWWDSQGFDINAKIPEEFVHKTRDAAPRMLQSLLADRFQLVIRREERQIQGFFLVIGKKGPKMTPTKPDEPHQGMNTRNTHMVATGISMDSLARHLTRDTGKLVVDHTGLTGGYNFELDWAPDRLGTDASSDTRPTIYTALQEQLGLRLESAKVPIQAIVVVSAVKPEGN